MGEQQPLFDRLAGWNSKPGPVDRIVCIVERIMPGRQYVFRQYDYREYILGSQVKLGNRIMDACSMNTAEYVTLSRCSSGGEGSPKA